MTDSLGGGSCVLQWIYWIVLRVYALQGRQSLPSARTTFVQPGGRDSCALFHCFAFLKTQVRNQFIIHNNSFMFLVPCFCDQSVECDIFEGGTRGGVRSWPGHSFAVVDRK